MTAGTLREAAAGLSPAERRRMLELLEARKAAQSGQWETPGKLAARITEGREAQRAHLDLIDDVLGKCLRGEVDRVMIFMPPQTGKSRRVAEWGPTWLLHHRPDWRVGVVSYADALARRRGRFVRNTLTGHPELGLRVASDSKAADRFDLLGSRGGMQTFGIGTGMTGYSLDGVIIDDPIASREDADSEVVREKALETYRDVIEQRLGPEGFVVLMMTRWHEDDLAGHLLKEEGNLATGGRWLVLSVPALAEDHAYPVDPQTGERVGACACGRPDDQLHDPLGREPGEPLDHPRMSRQQYQERAETTQRTSPRTFASLLQQRPTPKGGGLVDEELLRGIRVPVDAASPAKRTVVALDPSGGGHDEAGLVAGHLGTDRRAYLTHDRSARMSAAAWGRAACLLAHEVTADAFVVEKNYGGDQAGTILTQAWQALLHEGTVSGLCPRVVEVTAKKGKVARAEPVAQAMREDRVRLAGVFPQLEAQWATYQQGQESPDRLDASVYLVTNLLPPLVRQPAQARAPQGTIPTGAAAARR